MNTKSDKNHFQIHIKWSKIFLIKKYWKRGFREDERGLKQVSHKKAIKKLFLGDSRLGESRVSVASKLNGQSGFLSCSAPGGVTVQLPCMLCTWATFGGLQAVSHLRVLAASLCFTALSWAFLYTLSHTTLTWFPPKYRVSKCYITSKFVME